MDDDFDFRRPFRRRDGLAAGLTPRQLRSTAYTAVTHGVYVATARAGTPLETARALLTCLDDDAWASHATAGRVHGMPLPTLPLEHVSVRKPHHRCQRDGVVSHVRQNAEVVVVGGVRMSSYRQTFVELGTQLSLVDLVVVGDWLVRWKKVTLADLTAFCRRARGPGARAARQAAALVREEVDSPMETRLRLLIVFGGLPEPTTNVVLRDEYGEPVRQHDLGYVKQRVAVDYDGRQHIEREESWENDLERREQAHEDDWRTITVTAKGVYRDPERTLMRIHRVARQRGVPGVPTHLSDEWRKHFPGRG